MRAEVFANGPSCTAETAPIPTFPQRGKESNHITHHNSQTARPNFLAR
jgi:hypothetical protein